MGLDSLSPWDAYPWFDTPVQTDISLTGGVQTLVNFDIRRVVLLVLISPSIAATVGLNSNMSGQTGHQLNQNQPMMEITQATHGPLVAQKWFVWSSLMGGTVSVIEVKLRDWPRPGVSTNEPTARPVTPTGDRVRRLIRRATGRA